VDNVQQQFIGGLADSIPRAISSEIGPALRTKLCQEAVRQRCNPLRGLASLPHLTARIANEVAIVSGCHAELSSISASGAAGWLEALLLGRRDLGLPAELADFVSVRIARHLDPYIDGDATQPPLVPFLAQLEAAYQQEHEGRALPLPSEMVLGMYMYHAVSKLNATHCFGELMMGQGRLPVLNEELEAHVVAAGKSVAESVRRDFGDRSFPGMSLSAAELEALSRKHASFLYQNQQAMSDRLLEANAAGDVRRKQEVKRIFGIDT